MRRSVESYKKPRLHSLGRRSLSLALLLAVGCGGGYQQQYEPAPEMAQANGWGAVPTTGIGSSDDMTVKSFDGLMEQDARYRVSKAKPQAQQQEQSQVAPMVVYSGTLYLRVKRLVDAMDKVTVFVESIGGFVQSAASQVVIVRVPAARFEEAMTALAAVGEVLDRQVHAQDVGEQFSDLNTRLGIAEEARARLLSLLEREKDVKARLKILQEIQRLSEFIETTRSTLKTLESLTDYSTITLTLEPVVATSGNQGRRSPFAWIRCLEAHRTSLPKGKDDVELKLPNGFVLFDDDEPYRAQAADTTALRVGLTPNEPRGDAEFWTKALEIELTARDEEPVADGLSGQVAWRTYRSKDDQPRYYLVGVLPQGEDLYVVEAFFPNEVAYNAHHAAVVASLTTLRIR